GTATHSFLRSVADRLPRASSSTTGRISSGLIVDAVAAAAGLAATRVLQPREAEPPQRSLARLAAASTAAAAVAGVAADLIEFGSQRWGGRLITVAATVGTWAASYGLTHPGRARAGSYSADGTAEEDVARAVSLPTAMGMGPAVTLSILALGVAESALSTAFSHLAARVLGGTDDDRRTAGRILTLAGFAGLGWAGLNWVNGKLTTAGESLEAAHAVAPSAAEVTGGPGSTIDWDTQSRESRRWLTMALPPADIEHVMGESAHQPIRVYASLEAAASAQERAAKLLAEIDRTRALERPVFVLFSPTGSGYVNYVATETLEYLTRGNCASAAIQYSVLPSALSLGKVHEATAQTRIVVNGIVERLLTIPAAERPRFLLFGESLGSQVSQEMFAGQGISGPAGIGLDAAVWIGTPAATEWRAEIDNPDITATPVVQDGVLVTRGTRDWLTLSDADRASVRYLLLQNGDDPIPKFESTLLWRRPGWLGPDASRPHGAPRGTRWLPVTTFFTTFIDLQNALAPTPGTFGEGGHDYRLLIPETLRTVFNLEATDTQMARVQQALRARELSWETKRRWDATSTMPAAEQAAARADVEAKVSEWTGKPVDDAGVQAIIDPAAG
ncbi:MAG: alpha/beta-hydrolase family protein, partial [Nakamurella sp.]